ncbi:class C beta-lactamase [Chelativorans sp. YIM 93263]|uniref:class C beta-lactamase n=1 Tax=Chelativorans sp. YIM 93263 TaxID=2906648 RepID=UPI0023781B58|nr:class C beta-lactamase [Chelativorans sp. YIM 93263]
MKLMNTLMLAAFAFAVPNSSFAQASDTIQEAASSAFRGAVEEYRIPGLIVGVTMKGEHSYYATGLASRSDVRPVTPNTLFELGSLSKLFNVTLASLAEQRGILSLNDSVSQHVCADVCSIGDNMTLMDLATHHSGGLPLQVPGEIDSTDALVDWLKDWQPAAPGQRSYSNISIGLLGHITASALGMSYTQAVQNVLLPELGLENTWIEVPAAKMDQYAFGYDRKTDAPIRVNPGVLDAEAYGVKSSAHDMLKFLDIELGRGEVSPELRAAVDRTRQGQFASEFFTQNMIWEQYPWPIDVEAMVNGNGYDFILQPQPMTRIEPPLAPQDNVILNKTGSTNGFGGYVAMVPGEELGIVVLANRNFPNEARVRATYDLIEALLHD